MFPEEMEMVCRARGEQQADSEAARTAEYIRYQPSKAGGETNSGASERIIKMHEMPVDPLEPPKFKHKKAPRGPPSPPVPVMHSPPRKVSQKDMQVMHDDVKRIPIRG